MLNMNQRKNNRGCIKSKTTD